jgi:two-component system sensor kinase FixL
MAATLAHELNQPLAAIANYASGCSQIITQSGMVSEDLNEGLSAIAAASHRAGRIITGLRKMTKRIAPTRDVFDLSVALEESVHLVRAGGCNNVSIRLRAPSSFLVLGDRIQIQQVMVNLLRNACHAAEAGEAPGTVLALTGERGGNPCAIIRDNGGGLRSEVAHDPFKWVESAKPDGMGIGLSICRTIIEAHAGRISVDKTGPLGTTFSFELPALLPQDHPGRRVDESPE